MQLTTRERGAATEERGKMPRNRANSRGETGENENGKRNANEAVLS